MTTTVKFCPHTAQWIITRSDGQKITVWDIGRCWKFSKSPGCIVDVSNNISRHPLRTIRRWFARNELPVCDVHA